MSERFSIHASWMRGSNSIKPGRPPSERGGKYVPPKNGSRPGVRNTLSGHPPPEPIACIACM